MKKLFVVLFLVIFLAECAFADTAILNDPEQMAPPEATWITFKNVFIDLESKTIVVRYAYGNESGAILKDGRIVHTWVVRNIPDNPETDVTNCIGPGDPYSCCTGVGTGNCDETNPEFNNLFLFVIRSQDVGRAIGRGLRDLIWHRMKDDILSEGNDGSFGD